MSYFFSPNSATGTVIGPGTSTDRAIPTFNGTTGITLRDNSGTKIDSSGNLTHTTSIRVGASSRVVTPSFASNAGFIFLGNNTSSNDAVVIGNHASSFGGDSFIGFCRGSDGGLTGLRKAASSNEFWFGDWAGAAIWETNSTSRRLGVQTGTATGSGAGSGHYAYVGGTLKVLGASSGNVGTGVDTLQSFTVPANTLASNGQRLEIRAWGTFANNSNTKQVWLNFGGLNITSGAQAFQDSRWYLELIVIRTSSTSQDYVGEFRTDDALGGSRLFVGTGSVTLTASNNAYVSAEATSDNDVLHETHIVSYYPQGL